ncbi:MAG: FRG domain-containing protein [Candidatus Omnitrophota bacterium]
MEEDKTIKTWEDFEKKMKEFHSEVQEFKKKDGDDVDSQPFPLFRGQSNKVNKEKKWELESTLNRWQKDFPVEKYHQVIQSVKPAIESFTSKHWKLTEDSKKFTEAIKSRPGSINIEHDLEFMAHLRHTGFPSPLLDWTRSPYLAAFFAFNEDNEDNKTDPAIFMSIESSARSGTSDKAAIWSIGSNLRTHRRHYLQQSDYTFSIKTIKNTLCYTSHEDAFSILKTESKIDPNCPNQYIIKKYTLPYSQRAYFLSKLNSMNINAYSLFETEEGLMNKLANEEFLIKRLLRPCEARNDNF